MLLTHLRMTHKFNSSNHDSKATQAAALFKNLDNPKNMIYGGFMHDEKKMTPIEFWTSVKITAETTLAQLQHQHFHDQEGQSEHCAAVSSLLARLQEQA